ncbi:MAG: dienelactone hydrolase family protein [Alphaproteobacteria bacterium]|nr:dienelactone hydrolase family protein [Alphaproteobacteria bacterium]
MSQIQITTLDGTIFNALLAMPEGGNGSGLILIRGLFSKDDALLDLAKHYASLGFITVCPDLFHRQREDLEQTQHHETDWELAARLYKSFDVEAGVRDLLGTLAHIRQMPECGGKVGTVGYCLGARLAYLMATRSDVDCAVSYYGVGIDKMLDEMYDIRSPYLIHLAENDKLMPPSTQQRITTVLAKNKHITVHVYPCAEHGFARKSSMAYNPELAAQANERTDSFLKEVLQV